MIILQEVINDVSPNIGLFKSDFGYPGVNGTFGVFMEEGKEIGAIDYDVDINEDDGQFFVYIHYIASLDTERGNARKMIEHLFSFPGIQNITGASSIDAEGFWEHIGAVFEDEDESEEYRGNYDCKPFALHKTTYFNLSKECSSGER